MKVIFSHGKESGPRGSKIQHLTEIARKLGCDTESVDYTDTVDPELRASRLLEKVRAEQQPFVLVGSSMGGYASIVAAMQSQPQAVFLMAPALYMPGYKCHDYPVSCHVEIVHGWQDAIVPVEHSLRFAKEDSHTLHLLDSDHRLTSVITDTGLYFDALLQRVMRDRHTR